jgi:arylsulfatase
VFFGNLYHLNAEQEPEHPDYPKNAQFKERFGPRGMLRCVAKPTVNPAPPDPRFGPWGKQSCKDTGPLTMKLMENDTFLVAGVIILLFGPGKLALDALIRRLLETRPLQKAPAASK